NIDLKTVRNDNDELTPFEGEIRDARRGKNSGFPGDPAGKEIGTGPVFSTVGQTLTGDNLRSARAIQCVDQNGASKYGWVTEEGYANVVWDREGKLLGAVSNGKGYSMQPGFVQSLFNPMDLLAGVIAGKLFSKSVSLAIDAIESDASTTLRGVSNYW